MLSNRGKGMTLDYAIRLSVNAVAIVVGYQSPTSTCSPLQGVCT